MNTIITGLVTGLFCIGFTALLIWYVLRESKDEGKDTIVLAFNWFELGAMFFSFAFFVLIGLLVCLFSVVLMEDYWVGILLLPIGIALIIPFFVFLNHILFECMRTVAYTRSDDIIRITSRTDVTHVRIDKYLELTHITPRFRKIRNLCPGKVVLITDHSKIAISNLLLDNYDLLNGISSKGKQRQKLFVFIW